MSRWVGFIMSTFLSRGAGNEFRWMGRWGDGGVMGSNGKIGGLIRFNGILITVLGDHCSIIHSVEG